MLAVVEDNSDSNQQSIDFDTYRLLSMYAEGVSTADIALAFDWVSPGTVYTHLKHFPKEYKEAKQKLIEKRNAKYRRAGVLAIDIQIATLENAQKLIYQEHSLLEELEELQLKTIEFRYDEKRIAEGTPDDVKIEIEKHNRRILQIENALNVISDIRANIKDFKDVGEAAERRADLNEGKPTERTEDINRPMTVTELETCLKSIKDAGTGLDNHSIQS